MEQNKIKKKTKTKQNKKNTHFNLSLLYSPSIPICNPSIEMKLLSKTTIL